MADDPNGRGRGPNVRVPPPLLFALGFFAGWLVERRRPLAVPGGGTTLTTGAGWTLVVLGLALSFWALGIFLRRRTGILPGRPAAQLVEDGPYRFSRNPIYLGMIVAYLGGVLVAGTLWPLAFLPIVLALLVAFVVRPEERYLAATFGARYAAYAARVRRWL